MPRRDERRARPLNLAMMDVDGEPVLNQETTIIVKQTFVVNVDEGHPFDLEAYVAQYSGE